MFLAARVWMSPGPTATPATTSLPTCARNVPAPPATTPESRSSRGRGLECRGYLAERLLLLSGVVAGGAGTFLAQVGKLVVAGVAGGPGGSPTRAGIGRASGR